MMLKCAHAHHLAITKNATYSSIGLVTMNDDDESKRIDCQIEIISSLISLSCACADVERWYDVATVLNVIICTQLQGERSYSPAIIRETRASLAGASQIFLGRPFRPGV